MKMPKPTDTDRERFAAMVPDDPRVEVKPMFGNLGAFVNGNMFMGLFGASVGVKLSRDAADQQRKAVHVAREGRCGPSSSRARRADDVL